MWFPSIVHKKPVPENFHSRGYYEKQRLLEYKRSETK
jgi:hypothetical protein